jgi:iron complex transport system permease protein
VIESGEPRAARTTASQAAIFSMLPASALLGAVVMEVVDIVARVLIPPAELPIGIITAVIGAPVFLWILLRQRRGLSGFYG